MIYNHPVGGLGNMFFQIASLWTLAKDNGDELCLLDINKAIENLINYSSNPIPHANKFRYLFDRFQSINRSTVDSVIHIENVIQYPFKFTPLQYKNGSEYVGYFQCEKYFKHRKNEILDILKPADEFNDKINQYQHLFGNISLHIRRGNYVNWSVFDIIKMDYYQNAISSLPDDLKIVIFSNDLEWCKNNFVGERFVFVDEIDYISIYVMSKMKYHIIPNSSFSWWGAWMSEYNDGIIIAPKLWFGNNFEDGSDIVPDNWIKM